MSAAGIGANEAANSAAPGENPKADLAEVRRALMQLCKPGELYELRALPSPKGTASGYFADFEKLAQSAVQKNSPSPPSSVRIRCKQAVCIPR